MKNRLKIILAVTVVSGILSLLLLRLLPIGPVKDELQVIICFIMGIVFLGGIFWMFLWKKSYRIDYRKNVLKEDI